MAYTKYTGGNKELDDLLKQQSDRYNAAREQGDVDGMREANDRANQIRNEYGFAAESVENDINYVKGITGYNGGSRGSGSSSSSGSRRQSYSYKDAPTYTSKYQGMIDDLLGQYMDRPAFSYDAESDPTYLALRDQYTNMGQNAMQDTLGQISARTGGLASSYAGSAAQQAYNSYMNELSGFIPELEHLAYERWQDQGNDLLSQIDLLTALEQGDYGKYQDLLNQYNADRAFDYGLYSDEWNRNYQTGRDAIADQRYDQEWAYGVMQDQQNRQDQLDMNRAELLAATGDFSGYADIFGLSEAETQRLVDQYARQQGLTEAQAARDLADWMAQYGDLSGLQGLGVDTSYQEQLQDAQLADYWSSIYSKYDRGSDSSEPRKPNLTYNQMLEAIDDGNITPEVEYAYQYYFGEAYGSEGRDDIDYGPGLEVDMNSVIDLGYGPLSAEDLDRLVQTGQVEEYQDGNYIRFRRTGIGSLGGR